MPLTPKELSDAQAAMRGEDVPVDERLDVPSGASGGDMEGFGGSVKESVVKTITEEPVVPVEAASSDEQVSVDEPAPEPVSESAPEVEPEVKKSRVSKQWALAQKKERTLQKQQQELQEMRDQMQKQQQEIQETARLLQEDPAAFAERQDPRFYEKLTKKHLGEKEDPEVRIERLERELEDARTGTDRKLEELQLKQQQAKASEAYQQYAQSIYHEIESNDDYELIKALNMEDEAVRLSEVWYQQYKEILTPADAASKISKELGKSHLPGVAKTKALQAYYKDNPDVFDELVKAVRGEASGQEVKSNRPSMTVSNSQATNSPVGRVDQDAVYSRQEEIRRAMELIPRH